MAGFFSAGFFSAERGIEYPDAPRSDLFDIEGEGVIFSARVNQHNVQQIAQLDFCGIFLRDSLKPVELRSESEVLLLGIDPRVWNVDFRSIARGDGFGDPLRQQVTQHATEVAPHWITD